MLMEGREELRLLQEVCDTARERGGLSDVEMERLNAAFGERFERGWRLVEEGRIKRYIFQPSGRTIWIAVGKQKEYLILPRAGYCSCGDFYFRVVDGEAALCYHLIGQRLAEALGAYEEVYEGDEFYDRLMEEWRAQALEG
jgi:predicted nucleic acid-binding Zn finger protein